MGIMPKSPEGYGSDAKYYFDDEIAECSCENCKPYRMCWPREMFGTPKRRQNKFTRNCNMKTRECARNEKRKKLKYGRDEKGRALKKDGKPKARPKEYPDKTQIESSMKMLTRRKGHNETHAECAVIGCGWHPKKDFNKGAKTKFHRFEGDRGCKLMCRKHEQLRKVEYKDANPELYVDKWRKHQREKAKNTPLEEKIYKRYEGKRSAQGDKVDITYEEWLRDYWTDTCPYFHLKFINHAGKGIRGDDSPSVDRIDSNKPYSKDNIEIVSWRYNHCKSDTTIEERFAMGAEAAKQLGYKWPPEVV